MFLTVKETGFQERENLVEKIGHADVLHVQGRFEPHAPAGSVKFGFQEMKGSIFVHRYCSHALLRMDWTESPTMRHSVP